jgi:hypothetical protein
MIKIQNNWKYDFIDQRCISVLEKQVERKVNILKSFFSNLSGLLLGNIPLDTALLSSLGIVFISHHLHFLCYFDFSAILVFYLGKSENPALQRCDTIE